MQFKLFHHLITSNDENYKMISDKLRNASLNMNVFLTNKYLIDNDSIII